MKPCKITADQDDLMLHLTLKRVVKAMKDDARFNMVEMMQGTYDAFVSKNMDEVRALTLVSLMPKIVSYLITNMELMEYLAQHARSIKDARTVVDANKDDLTQIRSYIKRDKIEPEVQPTVAVEETQEPVGEPEYIASDIKSTEAAPVTTATEAPSQESAEKTPISVSPIVQNAYTTTILEAYENTFILDSHPVKVATGAFVRENILEGARDIKDLFRRVPIKNNKFRLRLVAGSTIPAESRIKVNGQELPEYSGPVMVFIDNNGNVQEKDGYIPHNFLRTPEKLEKDAKRRERSLSKEEIDAYAEMLSLVKQKLSQDPSYSIDLNIEAATYGRVRYTPAGQQRALVKDVTNLDRDAFNESLFLKPTETGASYHFTQPSFGYEIETAPKPIAESQYATVLEDLFNSDLTLEEKKDLAKDILYINEQKAPYDGSIGILEYLKQPEVTSTSLNVPRVKASLAGVDVPFFNEETNKWETQNVSLADYIYENFTIPFILFDGNKLFSPHYVLYYQPFVLSSGQELQNEAIEQAPAVTELDILDDDADLNFLTSQLKKVSGISNEATEKQIEEARLWWEKTPLAQHISFENMMSIVNEGVLGQFINQTITLFAGSNMTDIYHEAWHGFSQRFLTKEQKIQLYQAVMRDGKAETFLEAEEWLAEAFRKYAMSGGKKSITNNSTINKIFKAIMRFFAALGFTNKTAAELQQEEANGDLVGELFEKLYIGNISEFTPSDSNVLFGGKLYKKGILLRGKEFGVHQLTTSQSKKVSAALDSAMAQIIHTNGLNPLLFASNREALVALYLAARTEIRKTVNAPGNTAAEQKKKLMGYALDSSFTSYEELAEDGTVVKKSREDVMADVARVIEQSRQGFNTTGSVVAFHMQNSPLIQDLENLRKIEELDTEIDTYTPFERAGNDKSIRDVASGTTLFLMKIIRTGTKDEFGLPKLHKLSTVFNKVEAALLDQRGMLTFEQLFNRLEKVAEKDPAIRQLLDRLGRPDTQLEQEINVQTDFWQTFSKGYAPISLINTQSEVDSKGNPIGTISVNRSFAEENSTYKTVFRSLFFNTENKYSKVEGTSRIINLRAVLADFPVITKDNAIEFVKASGILPEMSPRVEAYIVSDNIVRRLGYARNQMEEKINKGTLSANLSDPFKHNDTVINSIRDAYRKAEGHKTKSQKMNANSDPIFDHTIHNQVTILVEKINAAENLQALKNNPATAHMHPDINPQMRFNFFMNTLFNMETGERRIKKDGRPVELQAVNIGGVTSQVYTFDNEGGRVKADAFGAVNMQTDSFTKLHVDIHNMFKGGIIEALRASDKTTSLGVILTDVIRTNETPKVETGSFTNTLLFSISDFDGKGNIGNLKAARFLREVLAGEILRMRSDKSTDFYLLDHPDLLDKKTRAHIIKEYVKKTSAPAKSLSATLANDEEVMGSLKAGVSKYIQRRFKALYKILEQNAVPGSKPNLILDSDIRDQFKNLSSPEYSQTALLKAFSANYLFHQMSFMQLFTGGIESYFVKRRANETDEEYYTRFLANVTKRMAFTSTGTLFRSDPYMVQHLNNKGRGLSKSKGYTIRPWDNTLRTLVIEDVEKNIDAFIEGWIERHKGIIPEEILDEYRSDINASDAQAYVSLDAYRLLSIAQNDWSATQESLYQRIVANGYYEGFTPEYFPVRKYQYYGPIINTTGKQALHKYALLPMIPSGKGTKMDVLHEMMMRDQIDYVVHKSGSKLQDAAPVLNIFNSDGSINEDLNLDTNRTVIHTDYLKNQVNINSQYKGKSTRSVQQDKLLFDGAEDAGKVVNQELADLKQTYLDAVDELINYEKETLRELSKDADKFRDYLIKQLDRREIAEFKKDAIRVIDGNFVYDFDSLPFAGLLERISTSIIKKKLFEVKRNGENLVQVSSVLFNKNQIEASDELGYYEYNNGNVRAAETKITLQGEYYKLLKTIHPDGRPIDTLERLNQAIKDKTWNEKYSEILTINGLRIPVQELPSMDVFKIVEFINPGFGNIVVVPAALTKKAGSDFDVDKLFMYMPNIKMYTAKPKQKMVTSGGITIGTGYVAQNILDKLQKKHPDLDFRATNVDTIIDALVEGATAYTITDEDNAIIDILIENKLLRVGKIAKLETEGKRGVENTLLLTANKILLHPANFAKLVSPISERSIKEDSPIYNRLKNTQRGLFQGVTDAFSYDFNLRKHVSNSVGKRVLGQAARDNALTGLMRSVDMEITDITYLGTTVKKDTGEGIDYFINWKRSGLLTSKTNLGSATDVAGISKQKTASQMINPLVDMGKDDWIADLSIDDASYSYYGTLRKLNWSHEDAIAFINTKAARDFFTLIRLQKSPFGRLLEKSDKTGREKAIGKFSTYSIAQQLLKVKSGSWVELINTIDEILVTTSKLGEDYYKEFVGTDDVTAEAYNRQLAQLIYLERVGRRLREILFNVDVDSKRLALFSESIELANGMEQILESDLSGVAKQLMEKTVLKTFSKNFAEYKTVFKEVFPITSAVGSEVAQRIVHRAFKDYINPVQNFSVFAEKLSSGMTYKGIPVVSAGTTGLKTGAYGLENITVDLNILEQDYRSRVIGGAKLYFESAAEYISFRLETEYQRIVRKNLFKEAVAKYGYAAANAELSSFALQNTLNQSVLLGKQKRGGIGYAAEWEQLLTNPETKRILNGYDISSKLVKVSGGILTLTSRIKDAEEQQQLQEEILELQNSTNEEISRFFKLLPLRAFYIHGFDTMNSSLMDVVPITTLSSAISRAVNEISSEELEESIKDRRLDYEGIFEEGDFEASDNIVPLTDEEVEEFKKNCGK